MILSSIVYAEETIRPFAEYERTDVVAMSPDEYEDSRDMKILIAKNLPSDVKLLFNAENEEDIKRIKGKFSYYISPSRMMFAIVKSQAAQTFWVRDSFPYPVIKTNNESKPSLTVVDSAYYLTGMWVKEYAPDKAVADLLKADIVSHSYEHFGGNLIANTKGDCFRVKSGRGNGVTHDMFREIYGCKSLTEFKFISGVGDIDERVKLISDSVAVTDEPSYKIELESKGFSVIMMPKPTPPASKTATYINSLLVNGTLFMPKFKVPEDEIAEKIYTDLKLKVYSAYAPRVSLVGNGNVHCFTANYPMFQ